MWIAAVIAAALTVALGIPIALLLGADDLLLAIGCGWLLGCASVAIVLAILSAVQLPWGIAPVASIVIALAIGLNLAARHKRPVYTVRLNWLDAIPLALIGFHLRYVVQPGLWTWENWSPSRRDFFFIWGARGRLFFESRGIDLTILQHAPNDLAHPDYPWLWPLTIDFAMLFRHAWDPRIAGVLTTAFGAATLLIFRYSLGRELTPRIASIGTAAAAAIALPVSAGFAEAPFIAYASSAVLLIRRRDDRLGPLLLGCAALTKNEGLAFLVAVVIAVVLTERTIRRLWPAAVLVVPWLVVRAMIGQPTDLFSGDVIARVATHLAHPSWVISGFGGAVIEQSWFFLALCVTLAVGARELARERFIIIAVGLQLAFDVAAYIISPLDPAAHVVSSWGRLMAQIAVPLLFVAISGVAGPEARDSTR